MCHALLQTPAFYTVLRRVDEDLARLVREKGCCHCGKPLHSADYPRKPRGCPPVARLQCDSRLSLCCSNCRRRTTPESVRFLGRRVYLAIIVVLRSSRAHAVCLGGLPQVGAVTLERWRQWWSEAFPGTPAGRWLPGQLPPSSTPDRRLMSLSIDHRNRWARLRFSVIGPLLASPPDKGELQQAFHALAAKVWRHPITGADVQFGVSTIERWFYRARHVQDPVDRLRNRLRDDCGHFVSLSPAIIEALVQQYRMHPG